MTQPPAPSPETMTPEQVVEEIGPGCGEWEDVSQEEVG